MNDMSVETIRPRRICFVTTEFHGLFRNGGIGTANSGLALALAKQGFDVTVAFADADRNGPRVKVGDFSKLKAEYAKRGINLDYVPVPPDIPDAFNEPRSASFAVYLYVQRGGFDVVLFNDNGAQGFYSLQAKHAGLFADPPEMYVVAHGPYDWVYELNAVEYESRLPVMVSFMERRCAELADVLISPSQYLVDWMVGQSWKMPQRHCVVQNVIGVSDVAPVTPSKSVAFDEIVFFGRQEVRKGFDLFCDAIDQLNAAVDLSKVRITVMGKFSRISGVHSGIFFVERARNWRGPLRILGSYDQAEALTYLRRPGVLAVIPSLAENSPCVVAECLELGIPFLATDGGGTGELVAEDDRGRCLFPPVASVLADRLRGVLAEGLAPAKLAISQDRSLSEWVALLSQPVDPILGGKPDIVERRLRVSICLVRDQAKAACISSIATQDYLNTEIVFVAADGREPDDQLFFGPHPIKTPAVNGRSRSVARNTAAAAAQGAYLLFVDEISVTLAPNCVSHMVACALRTGADIVTAFPVSANEGIPRAHHFPIGGGVALGALENCFGGAVILVRAAFFKKSGGFPDDCEELVLDWAFLAAAVLGGARLEVLPQPLFTQDRDAALRFDAGTIVRGHRSVLKAYGSQPASLFARFMEAMPGVRKNNLDQAKNALAQIGGRARTAADALSALEPTKPDADRAFVDYCCERRMVDLAIDFAVWNNKDLLNEVVNAAGRVREAEALAMIGQRRIAFPRTIDLTEALADVLIAIPPLRHSDLRRSKGQLVSHIGGMGVQIVKVTGGCPGGARAILGRAKVDGAVSAFAGVAIAIAEPDARLTVTEDSQIAGRGVRWSGWAAAPNSQDADVRLEISEPSEAPFDLYFLTRVDEFDGSNAVVTWQSVQALITVEGNSSTVDRRIGLQPINPDAIRDATLITDVSDFKYPVLVPGRRTLTHPVPGRTLLVRMARALPLGAYGLRCSFSIEHAEARPIDFGVWIGNPPMAEPTEADLRDHAAFSGWTTVRTPFAMQSMTLRLDQPLVDPVDIFLGVRVTEGPDVYFCHAYWHEFSALTSPAPDISGASFKAVTPPPPRPERRPAKAVLAAPNGVAGR